MKKPFVVISFVVAIAAIGAISYFAVTHWVISPAEVVATPPQKDGAVELAAQRKKRPEHGDFSNRFEPKPPPANGGVPN
jgi:hypothetical protein